mmetsp:Transcript_87452/g.152597  ORF Transcript_87452/g.152597 Transcript_87452/m.152597 type:complete len:85 (+) Transcript_87452:159-413(+)
MISACSQTDPLACPGHELDSDARIALSVSFVGAAAVENMAAAQPTTNADMTAVVVIREETKTGAMMTTVSSFMAFMMARGTAPR